MVVDATGRNRAVLKSLNIVNLADDHNLSFSCHLPKKKHPDLKHDVFVESFKHGWGLISGLGEKQNVVSIFTHQQSPVFQKAGTYSNWKNILKETKYLKHFLSDDSTIKVTGKLSNSSRPEKIAGTCYLAIGDAALAFDPLCSHGISNALYTAMKASEAIATTLEKEAVLINSEKLVSDFKNKNTQVKMESADNLALDPFKNYHTSMVKIFDAYLNSKKEIYQQEKRWLSEDYWSKL